MGRRLVRKGKNKCTVGRGGEEQVHCGKGRGRTSALWEREEAHVQSYLQRGHFSLGRQPVSTFMTQSSTSWLLLNFGSISFLTNRWVSTKQGHLWFQVLVRSMLSSTVWSLLPLLPHSFPWWTACLYCSNRLPWRPIYRVLAGSQVPCCMPSHLTFPRTQEKWVRETKTLDQI